MLVTLDIWRDQILLKKRNFRADDGCRGGLYLRQCPPAPREVRQQRRWCRIAKGQGGEEDPGQEDENIDSIDGQAWSTSLTSQT